MTTDAGKAFRIFWHRDLPPADAVVCGEGVVEAASRRVRRSLAARDRLWNACLADLRRKAETRIDQEMARTGTRYAHVLTEGIDTRRNDAAGEAWLHGQFGYVLLADAAAQEPSAGAAAGRATERPDAA